MYKIIDLLNHRIFTMTQEMWDQPKEGYNVISYTVDMPDNTNFHNPVIYYVPITECVRIPIDVDPELATILYDKVTQD